MDAWQLLVWWLLCLRRLCPGLEPRTLGGYARMRCPVLAARRRTHRLDTPRLRASILAGVTIGPKPYKAAAEMPALAE